MVSRYAYAFDQPTALADPSGLAPGPTSDFQKWLCGGSCSDWSYEFWHNPYASWLAGPTLPKVIGGAMIVIAGGYLAYAVVAPWIAGAAGTAGLGAQQVFQRAADKAASTPVGSSALPLKLAPSAPQIAQNVPTVIRGLQFTGHALDKMQRFGIPPSVVQNTIQTGAPTWNAIGTKVMFYDQVNNLTVLLNANMDQVITVTYGVLKIHA